jgi:hypothetical protein
MQCVEGLCLTQDELGSDTADAGLGEADAAPPQPDAQSEQSTPDAAPPNDPPPEGSELSIRLEASGQDAEETLADGVTSLVSSDLELADETQLVALRFEGLAIPQSATIVSASVLFTVDEVSVDAAANVNIRIEDSANPQPLVAEVANISSRTLAEESVAWSPDAWLTVGESNDTQRTTDLAALIQRSVSNAEWVSGNAIVLVFDGTGALRTAEAYDGLPEAAPLLQLTYQGAE